MKTWDDVELECKACTACSLYKTRKNCVFGTGNKSADIMFVGEAPGEREDELGIPFVGAAGELLNKYLSALGIDRDSVYIANILKCRPPHNRDPLPEEQNACISHLREQVKLIRPKIIVCLGRIAAMKLIDPAYKITQEHGTIVTRKNCMMTAVYHPAALLRDPRKKEAMWTDLKKIKAAVDEINGK